MSDINDVVRELVRITTGRTVPLGEDMETTFLLLKAAPVCLQSSEDYWMAAGDS